MSEISESESEYDRLARELRASAGPEAFIVDAIQEGLELEVFRDTRPGKILLGAVARALKTNVEIILDPNTDGRVLAAAVGELRAQHRILHTFHEVIQTGRLETRRLQMSDAEEPIE